MRRSILSRKAVSALLVAGFWLVVWQIASLFLPKVLFAGPAPTVQSLLSILQTSAAWLAIGHTLLKITVGFLAAFVLGCALAALCHRFSFVRMLLEPVVQVMKSVPVACFVVVALIWLRSAHISILTAFFVVFPVTYINVLQGLSQTDEKLLEMATVFQFSARKRLRAIYLPALVPYVISCCKVTVGMALKGGIAGEIIGLPTSSIGEQLYLSKLYLEVGDLFAWSIIIIGISILLEKLLVRMLNALQTSMEVSCD